MDTKVSWPDLRLNAGARADGPSQHREGVRRRRDGIRSSVLCHGTVRGVKITDYCDGKSLTTEERLALFVQVCRAVQHAHQKGIIHRDIKPSNILVTTTEGGSALPVVIDFGIVKATTNQRLTDRTLFTAFEMLVGTPAYMSPEQADMSGVDVDTRTDVYSLGVLLYELLTGSPPFDGGSLMKAGLDEIRRVIREREPDQPSMRLSTMAAADLTATAERRQSAPPALIRSVRGTWTGS